MGYNTMSTYSLLSVGGRLYGPDCSTKRVKRIQITYLDSRRKIDTQATRLIFISILQVSIFFLPSNDNTSIYVHS